MNHTLNLYRVTFKKDVDVHYVSREFVKAKSDLMAQWKIQDKFNISQSMILGISLWRDYVS